MNKLSSGKKSTIYLISVLVIALSLLLAVYYYLVMPEKDEVVLKKSSIASLQASAASLSDQIENTISTSTVDVFALRKRVPNNRAVDQLILDIEQMEFVSGVRINKLCFNNYDSLVSSAELTDSNTVSPSEEQSTDSNQSTEANGQTDSNASIEQNAIVEPVSTISPELKMLTLKLAIEAPTFDSLLAFIREVEQLERIIRIDMINYSLNGEESLFSEEMSSIVSANIQVTTFYYEGEE